MMLTQVLIRIRMLVAVAMVRMMRSRSLIVKMIMQDYLYPNLDCIIPFILAPAEVYLSDMFSNL